MRYTVNEIKKWAQDGNVIQGDVVLELIESFTQEKKVYRDALITIGINARIAGGDDKSELDARMELACEVLEANPLVKK